MNAELVPLGRLEGGWDAAAGLAVEVEKGQPEGQMNRTCVWLAGVLEKRRKKQEVNLGLFMIWQSWFVWSI